jgi:hypothetical protein
VRPHKIFIFGFEIEAKQGEENEHQRKKTQVEIVDPSANQPKSIRYKKEEKGVSETHRKFKRMFMEGGGDGEAVGGVEIEERDQNGEGNEEDGGEELLLAE